MRGNWIAFSRSPAVGPEGEGAASDRCQEHTLELRALVSAADASSAWDLRCAVREGLVDFLQRNYPSACPGRGGDRDR